MKNLLLASLFFSTHLHMGQRVGNIFSRSISYLGDSFPEVCSRVSGTCVYTVTDTSGATPAFDGVYRYDGRPEGKFTERISEGGKMTAAAGGQPAVNTDGSGIVYNKLIWGNAPATVKPGDTWTVQIPQPWELGGPGTETVTVMDVDAPNHTIRLKREGSSEGFYDNDQHQIHVVKNGRPCLLSVTPGTTHWIGYTTFKDGLVIADELLSTRAVTLSNDSLRFAAQEREYILLNEMPA